MGRATVRIGALAALAALAGCGASPSRDPAASWIFHGAGLTARIPPGWHVSRQPLTGVISPLQRLVVTSFIVHQRHPDGGCRPTTALREMPATGALLFMFEYEGPTHHDASREPARPPHFRLDPRTLLPYECMGRSYAVRFRDHGRVFQAHVFLGAHASAATRRRILGVLDSLKVQPSASRAAAVWVPPSLVLTRAPYLGVSCHQPNSVACDRVGLAVWLRAPAVAVSATIDGRRLALVNPSWSGPAHGGRRRMLAGFLRPAGLLHGGPLGPRADKNHLQGPWSKIPSVFAGVGLTIERSPRHYVRTSLRVELSPGWG
jgi:hypothetical protein